MQGTYLEAVCIPQHRGLHGNQAASHGGAEQQGLPLVGQYICNAPQLGLEGGVQQPVSLIQHKEASACEGGCELCVAGDERLCIPMF